MSDDMGYSDISPYGGEIDTPNLSNLAKNGIKFTQFIMLLDVVQPEHHY